MATSSLIPPLLLLLLSLLSLSVSALNSPKPLAFILPIKKDQKTLQYSASITMGTPPVTLDLVIDIRERFLWFECDNHYNSSTYRPVQCGTAKCQQAKGKDCITCTNHPLKTGCTNNTCGVQVFNPISKFFVSGDIGEDFLSSVYKIVDNASEISISKARVRSFLSSCVYPNKFGVQGFLQGLAKGKKGVLGLARTAISLPKQLASKYNLPLKFALCLPSQKNGHGDLFVGGGPMPPHRDGDDDPPKFLDYTPLIINNYSTGPIFDGDASTEYFIDVKSIQIDGEVVNFDTSLLSINNKGNGGTKLSTVIPHTKLHTLIYKPLVEHFVKQAVGRKMKSVPAVEPFGACFDSKTVGNTNTGPDVPKIDLDLNGGVQWSIYGGNSMVKVGKNKLCLGFVDGGNIRTSIVLGGHQLEDNFLEFDLVDSKLGFSNSLLVHNVSCSHNRFP